MNLREQYNRDGYLIRRIGEYSSCNLPSENSLIGALQRRGKEGYISYLSMLAKTVAMQQFFTSYGIQYNLVQIGISSPVIVSQPVLHIMSPSLRIPDGYYGTVSHQDWASVQGGLDMVTVWIALTDAGIGNFPLEVIPGSHLGGLREGKINSSVLEIECDEKEFLPLECRAGDVVFLSGFIIHRTGHGTGFRVAVSQRFDNASEPTFIERGYPCAQKRIIDREIRWKPTVEMVRKIYA